jgi:hypothetical protein
LATATNARRPIQEPSYRYRSDMTDQSPSEPSVVRSPIVPAISRRHGVGLLALATTVVALLAGCAPSAEENQAAKTTPSSSASSAPSPTPTPTIDVVAVISATAHNGTGETADLRLEIDAPRPTTAADISLMQSANCDPLPAVTGSGSLPMKLTTTTSTGWSADYLVPVIASSSVTEAWAGDWRTAQAYCADGFAIVPGTASGIDVFDTSAPVDSSDSWGGGSYGISESIDSEGDTAHNVTISNCTITLGPAAQLSARISAFTTAQATSGCVFGDRN